MAKPTVTDRTGMRQGHVTILRRGPSRQGKRGQEAMWVGRCDCGKERLVSTKQLRKGVVRTCGDYKCPYRKPSRMRQGIYPISMIQWSMTPELAEAVKGQNCYVCGAPGPSGIGLIDPKQDYKETNVYPVCRTCALSIGKRPLRDFLSWLLQAARRHLPTL